MALPGQHKLTLTLHEHMLNQVCWAMWVRFWLPSFCQEICSYGFNFLYIIITILCHFLRFFFYLCMYPLFQSFGNKCLFSAMWVKFFKEMTPLYFSTGLFMNILSKSIFKTSYHSLISKSLVIRLCLTNL